MNSPYSYAQESSGNTNSELLEETTFTSNPDNLVGGRFEIDEELAFSIIMEKYLLGEIFSIAKPSGLMFDFMAYMEIVRFPITENTQTRIYDGWYIKRENTFTLDFSDLAAPKLKIRGQDVVVDATKILYVDDILYIGESYVESWFGIKHEYRYNFLEVEITSRETLPFFKQLQRKGKSVSERGNREAVHPELFRGYEILSPQIFDLQLRGNYRDSNQQAAGSYGLIAARDVALMHANLFLSGTDSDLLSDSRLNVSKVSTQRDLLGFLNASKIEVGDVRPVRQGFSRNQSRGINITNASQSNTLDFEVTNITGNLQIGWDVELYRNGVLVNQEFDVQSGEYEFLDIPLLFGMNNFEIIKYGPEGQIEKEQREKRIDKNLLQSAGLTYAMSLTESGESVFNTRNEEELFDAGYNFSSDVRTTAVPGVLLGFGFQTDFGGDFEQSQYTISANTVVANKYALSGAINLNDNGRRSANMGFRTNFDNHSINLNYAYSVINTDSSSDQVSQTLTMNNNGSIPLFGKSKIQYSNEIRLDNSASFERFMFNNTLGYTAAGFGISHRLNYIDQKYTFFADNNTTETGGALTIQKGFDSVFSRLTASYRVTGENKGVQALSMATSWNMSKAFRLKLDLDYQIASDNVIAGLLFGWRSDKVSLFARAGHSSLTSWDIGVNARFSLSAQPLVYGDTYVTSKQIAESGSLSVRVFLDKNLNAKLDEGEMVIPEVKVELKQAIGRAYTNDQGIAVIGGIPDQTLTDIVIDQDTLPNPYLRPLIEGVSIRFRKGIADKLDFPVAMTSEIEGMVLVKSEKGVEAAARAKIDLFSPTGELVASVLSEYDGYFVFVDIFKGDYKLQINEGFTNRKQLMTHESKVINVSFNSELIFVDDIILTEKAKYDGFLAVISSFSSDTQLKVYLRIYKKQLAALNTQFITVIEDGKTHLTTGFYTKAELAEAACANTGQYKLPCEVTPYQYISSTN